MFSTLLQVALGGAIGASMRFAAGIVILRMTTPGGFPLAILTVNILGSFLMGIFVVLAGQRGLAPWGPFVMTGILGGFTTFSAFSLETVTLLERGETGAAALYVTLSVAGSVGGLFAGLMLARGLLA